MPPPAQTSTPASGINLGDITYALLRHKWKIVICALIGLSLAGVLSKVMRPVYQSDAKLYIRYVLAEGRSIGPAGLAGLDANAKSPDQRGETIMNSEIEILTSTDLAKEVAEAVGPAKLLGKTNGNSDVTLAAAVIARGLTVTAPMHSSIIYISFKHNDPQVVQPVLRELITRYLKTHAEIHRSQGILGDFIIQETDQLRSGLMQTEDELRKARNRAGVVSLDDAKRADADQMAALRHNIYEVQTTLAEKSSILQELTKRIPNADAAKNAETPTAAPAEKIEEYKTLSAQAAQLQGLYEQLLTQFTAENPRVKEVRDQLATIQASKHALQEKFPILVQVIPTNGASRSASATALDPVTLSAEVIALHAKLKVLTGQLEEVRADAAKLDQIDSDMAELKRKRDIEETNYKLFAAGLEQSRISEALGNGRISNIQNIQTPSPPSPDASAVTKAVGGVAAGGLALGLVWAILTELYLDRSLKRPIDVERNIRLPLFLVVPHLRKKQLKELREVKMLTNGTPAAALPAGDKEAAEASAPSSPPAVAGPLDIFHETLRDRLIGYFESRGLVHKPKLVAVTSLGHGAGVTTTAAGLARSLSETGEGNVLLVDMTAGQGSAQQFVKGSAVCGIDEMLDARQNAQIDQNLYVVAENSNSERLSRNLPQRFTKLVPKLKASDFDYIVFDMPIINQISITPRMAGFMDMVLLVVESEKTDREAVQRASALLAQSKVHIGVVLNKTRNYLPLRSQDELLACA